MPATAPLELVDPARLRIALGLPDEVEGDPWTAQLEETSTAAAETLLEYLKADEDHAEHAACKLAGMQLSIELWQAETAAGGQPVSFDGTPSTYRLSRFLIDRVSALIGPCRAVGSMVG